MKRDSFAAEAEVDVIVRSRTQMHAIAAALEPETLHPAGERAQATITIQGRTLKLKFRARDSSSLRAIMSSYLRMLRAIVNVSEVLLKPRHSRTNSEEESIKASQVL